MFQFFSSVIMLLVLLFLISGGVRTIFRVAQDEKKDVMELALTGVVLLCLSLYAGVLVALVIGVFI